MQPFTAAVVQTASVAFDPDRTIDKLGAGKVLETLKRLQGQHGARFDPAPILAEYAASGRKFY